MNKVKVLLEAPVLTQSGYGVHSRQVFQALYGDPMFDLYVEPLNWGATSHLTEDSKIKKQIKECIEKHVIAKHQNQSIQFDLYVMVTIPNEFKQLGKVNIGITAGIETDKCSHTWIQKCNEMDLIIVPSEHSKKVFVDTEVEWHNPNTKQSGVLGLNKPIVVCNEGVDTSIFKKFITKEGDPPNKINQMKFDADFNFLHIGQWGKGGFGEDRKNIANLVKYFIEAFRGRKDVGLVLKINMARNSVSDYKQVVARLHEIKANFDESEVPPIYLVHGNLTEAELASLYNHEQVKSFISLTHGEGYGLPLLEAAACELPVLATNWSGHLDFLKRKKFSAIEYTMQEIPEVVVWEDILIKGSRWAEVNEDDTKRRMKKMVSSYSTPKQWAKELGQSIKEEFDVSVVCQNVADVIKMALAQETVAAKVDPIQHLQSFLDTPDNYNVLYTMPMSTGDVFISTAVLDGLKKELPENAKIYFATQPQYNDVLRGNPHIHKVIPWNESMINVDLIESVFDLALTPNTATQYTFSNWVRKGQGRLLAEEFANHCQCELGDYHIELENPEGGIPDLPYMTVHPGSGQGQWEARKYIEWKEVLSNLKSFYPDLHIVQVGSEDELDIGVDQDLRGKTNIHQLAKLIKESQLHLSIDTFTMHLAAAFNTSTVALFGSSHAQSTGPWVKNKADSKLILLEAEAKMGCQKACYKYQCHKNKSMPCINEIDPAQVVESCAAILDNKFKGPFTRNAEHTYTRVYGKISGYTTTYNINEYPFIESIKSMLGFCDEVVVLDGYSDDGTYEVLEKLAKEDKRVQLYQNPWDFEEPGIDGMQKAYARALCQSEFLWQQDCDEIVHEDDYEKIKLITKRFPVQADILHLPVIELWGSPDYVTGRRHSWKWRMSRNKPDITHGINKEARLTDEKTGKVYAKQGMSDGCEYVSVMTYDMLPHTGFYENQNIEVARTHMPADYAKGMNQVFNNLPSVFHYSWCSLPNKIKNFINKWDKQWNALYLTQNVERFPNVKNDQIDEVAQKLFNEGGEESDSVKYRFKLEKTNPAVMKDWLEKTSTFKE